MDAFEQMKENFDRIVERDKDAKAEGKLTGRYVQELVADGYAYYVIIRENKKTVRIHRMTNIGDDWAVPYWGDEATIPKDYAIKNIEQREVLAALFSKQA